MSDQHAETLKYEATEIERLEAELAEANAKIEAARGIALQTWSDRVDFLQALGVESATPKPTDDGDFVVTPKGN